MIHPKSLNFQFRQIQRPDKLIQRDLMVGQPLIYEQGNFSSMIKFEGYRFLGPLSSNVAFFSRGQS